MTSISIKPGTTAYTIKPLVWERNSYSSICDQYNVVEVEGQWKWWSKITGMAMRKCDSQKGGESLCQQHWESEAGIGKFLERVE